MRLQIGADPRVTHVLTFQSPAAGSSAMPGDPEMLRVPNRPELAAGAAIRLRLSSGEIVGASAQALGPLPADPNGWSIAVQSSGPPGQQIFTWACTLTGDGIPSPVVGPWRVNIPKQA
jgi:hypothetical protein